MIESRMLNPIIPNAIKPIILFETLFARLCIDACSGTVVSVGNSVPHCGQKRKPGLVCLPQTRQPWNEEVWGCIEVQLSGTLSDASLAKTDSEQIAAVISQKSDAMALLVNTRKPARDSYRLQSELALR